MTGGGGGFWRRPGDDEVFDSRGPETASPTYPPIGLLLAAGMWVPKTRESVR
jgi:hypothetical protein